MDANFEGTDAMPRSSCTHHDLPLLRAGEDAAPAQRRRLRGAAHRGQPRADARDAGAQPAPDGPQIFIDDYHVGGFDDLAELDMEGKLDGLLGVTLSAATDGAEEV